MHTFLRSSLIAVSLAIGIAVALAVALRQPPRSAPKAAVPPPSGIAPLAPRSGQAAPTAVSGDNPLRNPVAEPAPVEAPYRDPIARQVGRLEETIQDMEEASQRRERSLLRAISTIQNQIEVPVLPASQPTSAPPTAAPPPEAQPGRAGFPGCVKFQPDFAEQRVDRTADPRLFVRPKGHSAL